MPAVSIEYISDYLCPWCYLGLSRLIRLQDKLNKDISLNITIQPYQLYPEIPEGGMDKAIFSKKARPGMGKVLKEEAITEDITINYRNVKRIPNSLKAHKCTASIADIRLRQDFALRTFKAYFEEGLDIENEQILTKLASEFNIEFENNTVNDDSDMGQLINQYWNEGIRVVPTLRITEGFNLPGLQNEVIWERYIRRLVIMMKG